MTQPILLTGNTYGIDRVPDAANAVITGNTITWKNSQAQARGFIGLPDGNWQLICMAREATEEIAEGIVQIISTGKISGRPQYRRYDRDIVKEMPARCWTRDSRHALETLLTSKGLNPETTLLIQKVG